ncbi:MAG: hypothetical protein HY554_16460 [Elusimicrobia bacterium]|nr:hypothetical protein [Elusimicrobiota bacterium]
MIERLLLAALAAAAAAGAPSRQDQENCREAYEEARGANVNVHLVLTSVQARLKRLQFAYNELGAKGLRDRARDAFTSYSAELAAFRRATDAADAAGAPADSASRRASGKLQGSEDASTAELINEILRLRASYDPAKSARLGEDVALRLGTLEARLPAPEPSAGQKEALAKGRALAKRARAVASALAPKQPLKASRAAREAARHLEGLSEDAAAAETELRLLEARYRLDALGKSLGGL